MRENGSDENRIGMARFGIVVDNAFGVSMVFVRDLAKKIGKDHDLALELWGSGKHEARVLAPIIADAKRLDLALMEDWVKDFYSWDLCDQCCMNLFWKYPDVRNLIPRWCHRDEEFVRRAGFVLMAVLAVKDKKASSDSFCPFLELIEEGSCDSRNNVKKGVNWALRQIGKRDLEGHAIALPLAERLASSNDRTARWIGKDAVRELRSEQVMNRLKNKRTKAL
ncbi:MAG: DNA alkylation repair enzyme [Methanomassiliicoccales archaeon PtaU1.Bin124]|nr:MAG: DNA alkylation repair enzyme [Methanomassiliicoccales archaeon PtaU1.Bin124]